MYNNSRNYHQINQQNMNITTSRVFSPINSSQFDKHHNGIQTCRVISPMHNSQPIRSIVNDQQHRHFVISPRGSAKNLSSRSISNHKSEHKIIHYLPIQTDYQITNNYPAIQQQKHKIDEKINKSDEQNQQDDSINQKNQELLRKISTYEQKFRVLQDINKQLINQLEEFQIEEKQFQKIQINADKLIDENQQLQKIIEKIQNEKQNLQKENEELKFWNSKFETQISELYSEKLTFQNQILDLNNKLQMFLGEYEEKNNNIQTQLNTENYELQIQTETYILQIEKLKQKNEEQQQTIQKLESNFQQESQNFAKKKAILIEQVNERDDVILNMKIQGDNNLAMIEQLKKEIKDLTKNLIFYSLSDQEQTKQLKSQNSYYQKLYYEQQEKLKKLQSQNLQSKRGFVI